VNVKVFVVVRRMRGRNVSVLFQLSDRRERTSAVCVSHFMSQGKMFVVVVGTDSHAGIAFTQLSKMGFFVLPGDALPRQTC